MTFLLLPYSIQSIVSCPIQASRDPSPTKSSLSPVVVSGGWRTVEQQTAGTGGAWPWLQPRAAPGLGCRSSHEQCVAAARVVGGGGGPRLPFAARAAHGRAATRLAGGGRAGNGGSIF